MSENQRCALDALPLNDTQDKDPEELEYLNFALLDDLSRRVLSVPDQDLSEAIAGWLAAYRDGALPANVSTLAPAAPPPSAVPTSEWAGCRIVRPLAKQVQTLLRFEAWPATMSQAESGVELPEVAAEALEQVMQAGQELHRDAATSRTVVRLSASVVVKILPGAFDPDEHDNTSFVLAHLPDFPCPAPLGVLASADATLLFQSFVEGTSLDFFWASLGRKSKKALQAELAGLMQQLRQIPRPPDAPLGRIIQPHSLQTTPFVLDARAANATRTCNRRFDTEADLNAWLIDLHQTARFTRRIRQLSRTDHAVVFTHGELYPRNILVERGNQEKLRVSGILDWATSGYYPEYWEYLKGVMFAGGSDWRKHLPVDAIGEWPEEWRLDQCLYFNHFARPTGMQ